MSKPGENIMKTFLSALAVAGVTVASAGQAMACDKMEKVTSAWLPIMQTTAYYVALEEKLFEKACIEIISNKMQSPNHIIDALVGGRADFGPPGAAAGIAMLAEEKVPRHLQGVRPAGRRHQGRPHQ